MEYFPEFTELTCVGRRAIATRAMKFLFEFFFAFRSAVKALLLTALVSNDIVANVIFHDVKAFPIGKYHKRGNPV